MRFNDNVRYLVDVLRYVARREGDYMLTYEASQIFRKVADECCNLLVRGNICDSQTIPQRLSFILTGFVISLKMELRAEVFEDYIEDYEEQVAELLEQMDSLTRNDFIWGNPVIELD